MRNANQFYTRLVYVLQCAIFFLSLTHHTHSQQSLHVSAETAKPIVHPPQKRRGANHSTLSMYRTAWQPKCNQTGHSCLPTAT